MGILNSISSFEKEQEEIEIQKEKELKKVFAFIYLQLDVYSDRQVFLWLDKKGENKYKIKFNMDDTINNKFKIKKSSELAIKKITDDDFTMSSKDLTLAQERNEITEEVIKNSIIINRIKKQFIKLAEKENFKITGSFIDPTKIIFYFEIEKV